MPQQVAGTDGAGRIGPQSDVGHAGRDGDCRSTGRTAGNQPVPPVEAVPRRPKYSFNPDPKRKLGQVGAHDLNISPPRAFEAGRVAQAGAAVLAMYFEPAVVTTPLTSIRSFTANRSF
jgi:hypothetical protein